MHRFFSTWMLVLVVSGCSNSDYASDPASDDASTMDASDETPPSTGCRVDADCPEVTTTPTSCAKATCDVAAGLCRYKAKDADGDGFAGKCQSTDPKVVVEQGAAIDCDDTDKTVRPGAPSECGDAIYDPADPAKKKLPHLKKENAATICQWGTRTCQNDGTFDACREFVGPSGINCGNGRDNDCNGIVDASDKATCTCSPGAVADCLIGVPTTAKLGLPATCSAGQYRCTADGNWPSTCDVSKPTMPSTPNCLSTSDNDCNGTVDSSEAKCRCDGTYAAGATKPCAADPTKCSPGYLTCGVTAVGASWSTTCAGVKSPFTTTSGGGFVTSFSDSTASGSGSYGSGTPGARVFTYSAPTGVFSKWTLRYRMTQTGNVDNSHSWSDPAGPAAMVKCRDGSAVGYYGSNQFTGTEGEVTCPKGVSADFYKWTNWGGGCCGGYTRTFSGSGLTYDTCP